MTNQTKIPEELVPLFERMQIWDFEAVTVPATRLTVAAIVGKLNLRDEKELATREQILHEAAKTTELKLSEEDVTWQFLQQRTADEDKEVLVPLPNGRAEPVFYWRHYRSPFDSHERRAAVRLRDVGGELELLARLSERVSERLNPSLWHGLASNPVWHPFYGIGVAAATDGVHVVMLEWAELKAPFVLVHRTNLIGAVTSTPTPTVVAAYCGPRAESVKAQAIRKLADED